MKKMLLILAAGFLATANIYAQTAINLTSSSYPSSVVGTDSLLQTVSGSTVPTLTAMTNGSWDMSGVTDSSAATLAFRVPTTTYQFADSNFYNFGGLAGYQGNLQSSITSSGILEYAIKIPATGVDLSGFSGTPGDSISFPAQTDVYSSARTKIAFPATANSSWTSVYHFDLDSKLTITLASLNHTDFLIRSYVTEVDTVIGWGKIKVKNASGVASEPINVLQVQTTTTTVDSFYLLGSADQATTLLSLIPGSPISQGQITSRYEQNYYRPMEVTPLVNVRYNNSAFDTATQATTHTQRLYNVGVANVANDKNVRIYPNPVTGNTVSIELPSPGGLWSYELMDISGKITAAAVLQANGTHAELLLPATCTPGIYYIRISCNGLQVAVRPLEIN